MINAQQMKMDEPTENHQSTPNQSRKTNHLRGLSIDQSVFVYQ